MAFGVGEEDFAGAADFGAVVPALEQGKVGLADDCVGRSYGCGEVFEDGFEAGFEEAAGELDGFAGRFWCVFGKTSLRG